MDLTPQIKTDLMELGVSDTLFAVMLSIPTNGILVWIEILVGISVLCFNLLKMYTWYQKYKKEKNKT